MSKKIVITTPWAERLGGAENMLWAFLRHADRSRIEPVVVFFEPGDFEREVAALGVRTATVRAGRLRHVRKFGQAVRGLTLLLRREEPDLLVNWSSKTHLYGSCAAVLAGMTGRVIWWQHGIPHGDPIDRLATLLPAKAVGCSSRAAAEAQRAHRPGRATFVVHPGITPPQEVPPSQVMHLRKSLQIPDGRHVIGIVARLQPWKRQDLVIQAVADLRGRGRDVHGLIVGGDAWDLSPDYGPRLRRLVRELGVADAVTFTGQVRDAGPYMRMMDVLINASEGEPFGLVILEGMAHGVPVVAVAAGGPAEIVEDEDSGLLIPRPEAGLLADALDRLLTDDLLRKRLAASGMRRVEESFTASRMTERLQQRLELLAS